jgi:hypothetical protein
MDQLITVQKSELTELFKQLTEIRIELRKIKEKEDEGKAFSIQQTADMLNLHYNSVRKLVIQKKLFAKFLEGDSGKTIIPYWSIKEWLQSKDNSNH